MSTTAQIGLIYLPLGVGTVIAVWARFRGVGVLRAIGITIVVGLAGYLGVWGGTLVWQAFGIWFLDHQADSEAWFYFLIGIFLWTVGALPGYLAWRGFPHLTRRTG